jgi:arginase family enzyme
MATANNGKETTMSIYDDLDRATPGLTAFLILKDGENVGRAIIRRKTAVTAYLQIWGAQMQKGQARGGGYDMASAAIEAAAAKLEMPMDGPSHSALVPMVRKIINDPKADGQHWFQRLERAGFTVAAVI